MSGRAGGREGIGPAAFPALLRWPAAYALALALSSGVGALTPLGAGNAVFLAGAGFILASVAYIRVGGEKTRVGRTMQGLPQWGLDPQRRRWEISVGLKLFFLGIALWAALPLTLL